MQKILFISDYSFKVPGGAQKSMEIIMNGLSDQYEFYVLMPGKKYEYDEKYKIIFLEEFDNLLVNQNLRKTIHIIKKLSFVINQLRPAIIHAHMLSGMSALLVLKLLTNINCITIYTERGVVEKYSSINKIILKKALEVFNKFITTTNYSKNLYESIFTVEKRKLLTIPNTAGPIFDNYIEEMYEKCREKYNLKNRTVMFSARYTYDKNWELTKQIIEYISGKCNFEFIIVVGSDKSQEDIRKCEILIQEIEGITGKNNIRTFIDLSLNDVNELYYASDIFILTSRTESFGRTAVEAMARKNIVFGTDVDGLSEVIGFEEYRYNSFEDFKEKFSLIDKVDINKEKERFYKRYKENFSTKINIEMHKHLYNELLKEKDLGGRRK